MRRLTMVVFLGSVSAACTPSPSGGNPAPEGGEDTVPAAGKGGNAARPGMPAPGGGGSTGQNMGGAAGPSAGGALGTRDGGTNPVGAAGARGDGGPAGQGGMAMGMGGTPAPVDPNSPTPPAIGAPGGRAHPSDPVFEDRMLRTWDITLTPADLAKIDKALLNPDINQKEVYVPATLKVDNVDVGKVAIRYKGAFGTLQSCTTTGVNTCKKMSYKIDFAEYDPNKRFHGLKKINLHAQRADRTHLHEKLGYQMFRLAGIPAPRSSYGKVMLNGAYKGLYGVTEVVDSRFIDYWFAKGQGDGNLYKEVWPISNDRNYYVSRQKTNEPDPKDPMKVVVAPTKILKAASAINGAGAGLSGVVSSWMNLDWMLKYLAVDRAVTNWDGVETFYAGGNSGMGGNHNFYMYESQTEDRLYLIPWDLDNTFQVYSWWESVWPWNMANPNCGSNGQVGTNWLSRPACDPIFRGLTAASGAKWSAVLKEFLDTHFDVAKMRGYIDQWAAVIGPGVMLDLNGPGYMPWQAAITSFKADLGLIREKMLAIAGGTEPKPFGLKTTGLSDFEGISPLSFAMGPNSTGTTLTTATHELNKTAPIAGAADVKLTFELRNSQEPPLGAFDQRAYVRLNFNSAAPSLASMTSIRMTLKADTNRPVRIEVGSSKYKTTTGRIPRLGWEVMATPAGTTVTLNKQMLAVAPGFMADGSNVSELLTAVTQLYVHAQPTTRDPVTGHMPAGTSEKGWLQIDNVEIQ